MISKRLHDYIYLKENKYKKTKEMFKFIEKEAFPIKSSKKAEQVCDIGCAGGNFLYYLSHRYKEKLFTGVEIRKDLLKKAKKSVLGVKFLQGTVLNKNLLKKKQFDKIFLIGVHPNFDSFEKCFSNLISWTKPGGAVFICDLFNPYPVDVFIRYKLSKNYKSKIYETGWNIFSHKSVSNFLKKQTRVKSFSFKKFVMPFDLKPKKDPLRSWTIRSKKERLMTNGVSIIQYQNLLKIRLKDK